MAYGNQGNSGNKRSYGDHKGPAPARGGQLAGTPATKVPAIFRTGLFRPDREGVKSIGSVQVKEDVVIPAGSYINLYPSDKEGEKMPAYTLSVTAGKKKA